jgi:hypothetical protein
MPLCSQGATQKVRSGRGFRPDCHLKSGFVFFVMQKPGPDFNRLPPKVLFKPAPKCHK